MLVSEEVSSARDADFVLEGLSLYVSMFEAPDCGVVVRGVSMSGSG